MSTEAYRINFIEIKRVVAMEKVMCFLAMKGLKQRGPSQWRGMCPFCGSHDSFVINNDGGREKTGAFNCFKCPAGGDQIELVSMMRGNPRKDPKGVYAAAKELHESFVAGTTEAAQKRSSAPSQPSTAKERRPGFDPNAYAKSLDPEHEALKPLAIEPDTLREWRAGYASTGVHRGRLAIPLAGKSGEVIGYLGRAIRDESPVLTFPNGIVPQDHIFGGERLTAGHVFLVRDPLDVLKAFETGYGNAVCFLTEEISPLQLECLAALMDERSCESLSFF